MRSGAWCVTLCACCGCVWGAVSDAWDCATLATNASKVADWMLAHPPRGNHKDWTYGAFYAGVTALCLVFCAIYEVFSFGEHSLYMRMMFMMPLLGGAVPFGLMAASQNPPYISRGAFNLWNSGLAVRVSGCLVRGIIEISGRVSDYDNYYWVISGILLALAFVNQVVAWRRHRAPVRGGR